MEYLFIYCLQLFDNLNTICVTCWVLSIILAVISLLSYLFIESERYSFNTIDNKNADKVEDMLKKTTITLLTTAIVLTFIPTKQTLLIMGGTWLGKKAVTSIVNDEKIQKVDTIINLELDKMIKDLKKDTQKSN